MGGFRTAPLLLAFCAVAVAALAVGPFLYRSMLPAAAAGAPPAGCSFVLVTTGLFVLLAGAAIWQLRRRRRPSETEVDRRLWEAVLGEEADGREESDRSSDR